MGNIHNNMRGLTDWQEAEIVYDVSGCYSKRFGCFNPTR